MRLTFPGSFVSLAWTFLALVGGVHGGDDLESKIRLQMASLQGRMAVAAKNLQTGEGVQVNGGTRVKTASVIKLPIMVEVFYQVKEGRLKLDDEVLFSEKDKVEGSGILRDLAGGIRLTLRDAVLLMIVLSDNTATNLVIEKVGIERVNARMQALGLKDTQLFKKVFVPAKEPQSPEAKAFGLGVTTSNDMVLLLEKIARAEILDRAACDQMIEILKKQRYRDEIPRYLGELGAKTPPIVTANKTGALSQVRNDVGLVFAPGGRYALAVFIDELKDTRWTADNEGTLAIARVSRLIVEHFEKPKSP